LNEKQKNKLLKNRTFLTTSSNLEIRENLERIRTVARNAEMIAKQWKKCGMNFCFKSAVKSTEILTSVCHVLEFFMDQSICDLLWHRFILDYFHIFTCVVVWRLRRSDPRSPLSLVSMACDRAWCDIGTLNG
jgi:hypothetical protein